MDNDGVIRIVDPVTMQEYAHFDAWKVGHMAISPDGLSIVAVSKPGELVLLRSDDLSVIATGDYPSSDGISDVEFLRAPHGIVLGLRATGGGMIDVRGYDLVRQMSFKAESREIWDISPSRITTSFATCAGSSSSESVKVWALDGCWKVVP
jgi:WD40 repeat protein